MTTLFLESSTEDYRRIAQAIEYLKTHVPDQPELAEVAAQVGLSEYHFQRLFLRWVGISPKRFLQFLTKEMVRSRFALSQDLLEASFSVGLSGPGRLHDLMVTCEAVTPGQARRQGEGLTIRYGFQPSPFGECLLAVTERGICGLSFIGEEGRQAAFVEMQARWPRAVWQADPQEAARLAQDCFAHFQGQLHPPLSLYLRGTNFQLKVWEALLRIPPGRVVSYETLAQAVGQPLSSRAVGHAVGANPVPLLIPCHRVIRKVGALGGYRWGETRKLAVLGYEMSLNEPLKG